MEKVTNTACDPVSWALRRLPTRPLMLPMSNRYAAPLGLLVSPLRERYRWQLIVRAADPLPLLRALTPDDLPSGWSVDLDPTNTA